MPAVSRGDAETPLAAGTYALLLHQPLHAQLAHTNADLAQLAPDARPAICSAMFFIHGANMRHQRFLTHMPPTSNLPPPDKMLMKAGDAHTQYPALNTDRP